MRAVVATLLALALAACGGGSAPSPEGDPEAATGMRFLGAGEDDGFERAFEPRPLRFPADHGSHPTFRTEWWYFTG
ncbi:MAG TPA: hypothetical protein VIL54_09395, partial [Natronosporangium sp.]